MGQRGREKYLDVIKVVGAIFIVALHTMSNTIHAAGSVSYAHSLCVHVVHQLLYTAVPVFVLATGAGFLATGRDNSYKGMRRNIIKLVLCIVLFGTLFWTLEQLMSGAHLQAESLIAAILGDATWSHMWYLYRLLGIYLCMPLLAAFVNHASKKDQVIFAGLLLFFFCIYPFVAGVTGFFTAEVMPFTGIWFFYALTGGMLGRLSVNTLRKYRWLALAGTAIGVGSILSVSLQQGVTYIFSESHPLTALLAISLFVDIRILCGENDSWPWQKRLAENSLGCYIIHPIFIHACVRILRFNPQNHLPILTLPITILVIFIISMAVSDILRHVPVVRKYLL